NNLEVLLVAVKKDKILNYTNVLSLAGKVPSVVDVDAFAMQNCYEFNYQPQPNSTVALLNIGASVLNINVVKGATTLFTGDVPVEVLNPFQRITMNGASGSEVVANHAAQLAVAVGLALRSFENL